MYRSSLNGWRNIPFSSLIGKTLVAVDGYRDGSEEVVFTTSEGEKYVMWHDSDCCETVNLVDADGDVADIIGRPVKVASCEEFSPKDQSFYGYDSQTWTFYHLAAGYGTISMRWVGSSNGYYSESVSFALDPSTAIKQEA